MNFNKVTPNNTASSNLGDDPESMMGVKGSHN
jgi:hypothetical protein